MEAPRLRVAFGSLRCFTVADLRRDLTRLSPALERRLIARSRFRTTHRSGSNWEVGSGQVGARQCPLWVISGHRSSSNQCPLYPRKRTLLTVIGMSALCQKQTYGTAANNRQSRIGADEFSVA